MSPRTSPSSSRALADANYKLDWIRADANHYDAKLIDIGGAAIKNTYIRSVFYPFEDAGKNPATQQYLDAFQQYLPNGKAKAYLGLQAWSAWLLWAKAAKECGANLTRKCVYHNAEKVKSWTGGGLHATQNPGDNKPGDCFAVIEATANRVPAGRHQPEQRHLQLQREQPVPTHRQLRQGPDLEGRREEHQRPEMTVGHEVAIRLQ